MKVAEATGMKPAEAAKASIDQVYGLTNAYLEQSKLLEGTLAKSTDKLGNTITIMLTKWYRSKEPDLIRWLDYITKWVSANEGKLIGTVNAFMTGLTKVGNVLGDIIGALTTIVDLMAQGDRMAGSFISNNLDTLMELAGGAYLLRKGYKKFAGGGGTAAAEGAAMDAVAISTGTSMAKSFGKQVLLLDGGIGIVIAAAFAAYAGNKSREEKIEKEIDDASNIKDLEKRRTELGRLPLARSSSSM